jgi:hypothetical protein
VLFLRARAQSALADGTRARNRKRILAVALERLALLRLDFEQDLAFAPRENPGKHRISGVNSCPDKAEPFEPLERKNLGEVLPHNKISLFSYEAALTLLTTQQTNR